MANPIWNGANAKWSVAADWSTGLPQPGDDVSIPSGAVLLDNTTGSTSVGSITVASTLNIKDPGATVAVTGSLTDNGSVSVDSTAFDPGGTTLAVGGILTVTNSGGGLAVGNYLQGASGGGGGTATLTIVTANSVTDTGTITIQSDQALGSRAVLNVASAAGFGGQTGVLTGNVNIGSDGLHAGGDGLLEFATGQITTIASQASLYLYGTGSFIADAGSTTSNSALTGLANVNGSLTLQAGVDVSPTGALTIGSNGTVAVDNAFLGTAGSKLAVGGVSGALLTVNGSLSVGRSAMTGNATVTAGLLSNPGTISLNGADASDMGLLDIAGSAGFGTANTLTGNVNMQGFSLLQFASGEITTIAQNATLESLIDSFAEQLSQVFMLQVFPVGTNC
jgi:fibronectin-binding autotransporter adhesin